MRYSWALSALRKFFPTPTFFAASSGNNDVLGDALCATHAVHACVRVFVKVAFFGAVFAPCVLQ